MDGIDRRPAVRAVAAQTRESPGVHSAKRHRRAGETRRQIRKSPDSKRFAAGMAACGMDRRDECDPCTHTRCGGAFASIVRRHRQRLAAPGGQGMASMPARCSRHDEQETSRPGNAANAPQQCRALRGGRRMMPKDDARSRRNRADRGDQPVACAFVGEQPYRRHAATCDSPTAITGWGGLAGRHRGGYSARR